jgi:hypothetical protein
MIPKSGNRFSDKIMRQQKGHDPEKWEPVSGLREAITAICRFVRRFGGRRQVGQDHAPTKGRGGVVIQVNGIAL